MANPEIFSPIRECKATLKCVLALSQALRVGDTTAVKESV
jgi:hypothetical protein